MPLIELKSSEERLKRLKTSEILELFKTVRKIIEGELEKPESARDFSALLKLDYSRDDLLVLAKTAIELYPHLIPYLYTLGAELDANKFRYENMGQKKITGSALHFAISAGKLPAIEVLLRDCLFNFYIQDSIHQNIFDVLDQATLDPKVKTDIVSLLRKYGVVREKIEIPTSDACMKVLFRMKLGSIAKEIENDRALHQLVMLASKDIISQRRILVFAGVNNDIELVNKLHRKYHFDINMNLSASFVAKDCFTFLYTALMNRRFDLAKLLIKLSSKKTINTPHFATGQTPLMLAAELGETDIVKQLLAAGADPSMRNNLGFCACDLATSKQIQLMLQVATLDSLLAKSENLLKEFDSTTESVIKQIEMNQEVKETPHSKAKKKKKHKNKVKGKAKAEESDAIDAVNDPVILALQEESKEQEQREKLPTIRPVITTEKRRFNFFDLEEVGKKVDKEEKDRVVAEVYVGDALKTDPKQKEENTIAAKKLHWFLTTPVNELGQYVDPTPKFIRESKDFESWASFFDAKATTTTVSEKNVKKGMKVGR